MFATKQNKSEYLVSMKNIFEKKNVCITKNKPDEKQPNSHKKHEQGMSQNM